MKKISRVSIKRLQSVAHYSPASTVLSPLCPPKVLPLRLVAHSPPRLLHSFSFPTPQLSRPRSFLRIHDCLINPKIICFILLPFFCNLSSSLVKKMAISHFQLVHKHHKNPRSAEVVKRTASACTSFLLACKVLISRRRPQPSM